MLGLIFAVFMYVYKADEFGKVNGKLNLYLM